ncbi:unnamed protein product [Mytilus coruscus]|uniref:F5/8 type C domain-containing protein n=1 Tax=Mytilus coruscus TaxID=42192 RepID=A0A6J8B6P1_MYTCO|nr:unnamed protein product [Mytilus coruscus]
MMTDCHGLPFACMLKQQKSGQSQNLYNNLRQKAESNTLTSTLYRQQQSIDSNGGYNPSNMAAIVKQNTESNSGNIGMTMGNSELLSFMNTGSTGQSNSMNGQGGSSQGRISNTNMQNGGTPLSGNMLGVSSNGQKSISIPKQGNGMATMFSGGGGSNSMNSMTNPFSKSMTNLIGNGGLQGSMQSGREPENVKGSVNQVQASVKDNQDNLKNILLQVVGNTCGLDWLNCAKDCFSVDKDRRKCSPLPPNCPKSCVIFDDNGCTVCSCESTPCPPFPDDCPRGFSKIDENRCPICTLDGSRFMLKSDHGYNKIEGDVLFHPSVVSCIIHCSLYWKCTSVFFNKKTQQCNWLTSAVEHQNTQNRDWDFYEMESGEVNVALLKPATQSSTFEAPGTYGATFATDGLVRKLQNGYWCTHTRGEFTPWLRIDLQVTFKIKKVVLVNRQDEHGDRLHDVEVRAGLDGASFPEICGIFEGPGFTGESVNIFCQKNTIGRFVRAQIVKGGFSEILSLCEMEIYTI